jgi:uncharacterized membrane protein YfcA
MEYLLIGLIAFLGSGLTFFSGFGLGTLLMPVFGLFFPIEMAIGMTAIVHLLNNLFKLILVGKHAEKTILIRFGIVSIIAALVGAYLLRGLSNVPSVVVWSWWGNRHEITFMKITIGILLIFFSLFEILPYLKRLSFDKKYLFLGGLLSGFFGGLSGNQGALRSAFLVRAGLSKEQFVATGVIVACGIDISRLAVYAPKMRIVLDNSDNIILVLLATIFAFFGAYLGNQYLKKVTIQTLQNIVGIALLLFGMALCVGIL